MIASMTSKVVESVNPNTVQMAGLADQVHACTSISMFLMYVFYIVFNEREVIIVMTRSYILFILFKNNCPLLCPDQIF